MRPLKYMTLTLTVLSVLVIYFAVDGIALQVLRLSDSPLLDVQSYESSTKSKLWIECGGFLCWFMMIGIWTGRAHSNLRNAGVEGLVAHKLEAVGAWDSLDKGFFELTEVISVSLSLVGQQISERLLQFWIYAFVATFVAVALRAWIGIVRDSYPLLLALPAAALTIPTVLFTLHLIRRATKAQESERLRRQAPVMASS